MLLTQDEGKILGPVVKLLGFILNGIFNVLNMIGIPNVGLAIIIFTLIIYICLLPLTIKQQKFSKLSAIMSPELNSIKEKYKGKTDQVSMQKQNEEMNLVYKKYGVSPTGSCVQLLIQMPILLALYRVIYNIPAYVDI
ncbi:MAG: YidC/Oxa1 family membrane protein insertase, partial [Lachnospiraceae bacterium]|nr:YidC/Oxa1 family membrane protein insertase [Lachnospiraceae bacterium]